MEANTQVMDDPKSIQSLLVSPARKLKRIQCYCSVCGKVVSRYANMCNCGGQFK